MTDILTDFESSDHYANYGFSDTVSEFGDEDDLWGTGGLTLDDLNDPAFAVKFDALLGAGSYRVDAVSIEVFYDIYTPAVDLEVLPPWFEENLQSGCVARSAGSKKFLVVGQSGLMMVSDDGQTWVDQESGTAETLRAITSTGDVVTAVGDSGTIVTSEDTLSWDEQVSGTLETLIGITNNFSTGNTLVVGSDSKILSRPNNSTEWEARL